MLRLRCTASSGRVSGVGANHGGASHGGVGHGGVGRGGAGQGGASHGGVGQGGAVPGSQEDPASPASPADLEVLELPASPELPAVRASPEALEGLEDQGARPVLEPADANRRPLCTQWPTPREASVSCMHGYSGRHGTPQPVLHIGPVDHIPPRANVVWAPVLIVDVVCVFPHVQHKYGDRAPLRQILMPAGSENLQPSPLRLPHQYGPA